MTNEELFTETSILWNFTGEDFYKDLRLVLLKYLTDKGPEYDLKVLLGQALVRCRGAIDSRNQRGAIYFLYALNFLQEYRFKKIDSELKELKHAYATRNIHV